MSTLVGLDSTNRCTPDVAADFSRVELEPARQLSLPFVVPASASIRG